MPKVGVPGQRGYREFPYTPEGQLRAKAYADQSGLSFHPDKEATGAPRKQRRPVMPPRRTPRRPAARMNIPKPSTRRY